MKHLSYTELQKMQQTDTPLQLIDVREPDEHTAYNIGGALIPLGVLLRHPEKIARDRPVILYCKRGIRSQLAIQRLTSRLPEVDFYNLTNGIYALFHG